MSFGDYRFAEQSRLYTNTMTQPTHHAPSIPTLALHALVIKLIAQESGALSGSVGELAHAAFYAAVQAVDPALSAQMHAAQTRKDFSLSPLFGPWRTSSERRIHVTPGQEGWLRVGLFNAHLFRVFMQHLLENHRPTIRLGDISFAITEVLGSPGSHPWCDYATLADLAAVQETPTRWTLSFESPTAFSWGKSDRGTRRMEVFPQPRMLVAGLRTRWDRWSGQDWGRDFEEWVERNVIVGRIWRWQTDVFPFQRQTYLGGLGKLEYRLLDESRPECAAHFNRLLHLAFYTGVGYKTTHGLGFVRLV